MTRARRSSSLSVSLVVVGIVGALAVGCGSDGVPDAGGGPAPAAATAGGATSSPEAPTTAPSDPPIDLSVSSGPPTLGDPACIDGSCVVPLTRPSSTVTGVLTGSTVSGGAGIPTSDGGYVGVGIHRFEGEVEGCGTGTVMWTESLTSTDGLAVEGTWTIVASSGTGDLLGLTGGGTFEGSAGADGSGTYEASGTVTCATG